MEIILKQDVKKLGYKGELLKVKDGYARNLLIPKGLAIQATESNRKVFAENQKQRAFKEEKIKKEAEELAQILKSTELKIGAKVSSTGKIFGSVNNIQIAEAIKKKGYEVDRKRIELESDIKEVGNYSAKIHLYKGIVADVKFEIIAE